MNTASGTYRAIPQSHICHICDIGVPEWKRNRLMQEKNILRNNEQKLTNFVNDMGMNLSLWPDTEWKDIYVLCECSPKNCTAEKTLCNIEKMTFSVDINHPNVCSIDVVESGHVGWDGRNTQTQHGLPLTKADLVTPSAKGQLATEPNLAPQVRQNSLRGLASHLVTSWLHWTTTPWRGQQYVLTWLGIYVEYEFVLSNCDVSANLEISYKIKHTLIMQFSSCAP